MYLLDTCVISELIRNEPDEKVINWLDSIDDGDFYLSVLTLGELQKGISKLRELKKKDHLMDWLETDLKTRFERRIVPITQEIAQKWGVLSGESEQKGRKLPVIDALIVATALHLGLVIVTRNVDDMEGVGAQIINPWRL